MKIHRFEKNTSRSQGPARRERETSRHDHPTLLEFSVEPLKGGAAAAPSPLKPLAREKEPAPRPKEPPARLKEPPAPARGASPPAPPEPRGSGKAPTPPSAEGGLGAAYVSGLLAERLAAAQQAFAQGQLTQARGILEKLVALGVGGAPARTMLGTIYMAQGSMDRALACFDEALEKDPSDLTARLYRGEVRLGWGDLLLAQQDMQYVLDSGTAGSPIVQQARRLLQRIDELKERRRR